MKIKGFVFETVGGGFMAYCGRQCPYHWHDGECEYCGARGNEVIDTKNYSYSTCPYYQEYKKERDEERSKERGVRAAAPSTGSGGCLNTLIGLIAWILIIAAIVFGSRSCSFNPMNLFHDAEPEDHFSEEPAEEFVPESDGFVFPNSDTELIGPQEAENLSDSDLTYAINEIYARHGYIFQNTEVREYYEQFSWYLGEIPSNEFSIDCFNQNERENWNLLVKERDSRKSG